MVRRVQIYYYTTCLYPWSAMSRACLDELLVSIVAQFGLSKHEEPHSLVSPDHASTAPSWADLHHWLPPSSAGNVPPQQIRKHLHCTKILISATSRNTTPYTTDPILYSSTIDRTSKGARSNQVRERSMSISFVSNNYKGSIPAMEFNQKSA